MVFILKGENSYLVLGHHFLYTVGRSRRNHIRLMDRNTDLFHGKIQVAVKSATIHDLQSEQGVFVNRKKIAKPTLVKPGDVIRFGENCSYKLLQVPMEAVFDKQISKQMKLKTIKQLNFLNMTWAEKIGPESCIYIINVITIDVLREMDVFWAVLAKNHVVTPKYVKDMCKNIQWASNIPNFYRYGPEIDPQLKEKGITSIFHSDKRRTLFKNLAFIQFKQNDELQDLIRCCGGRCFTYRKITRLSSYLTYIAINHNNNKAKKTAKMIHFLNEMKEIHAKIYTICEDDIYISIALLDVKGVSPVDESSPVITKSCKVPRSSLASAATYGESSKDWTSRPVSKVKSPIKQAKATEEDVKERSHRGDEDEAGHHIKKNSGKSLKTPEHKSQSVKQGSGDKRSKSSERETKFTHGHASFMSTDDDSDDDTWFESHLSTPSEDSFSFNSPSNKELLDLIDIADKQIEMIDSQKSTKRKTLEERNEQSKSSGTSFIIEPATPAKKMKSSKTVVRTGEIKKLNDPLIPGGKSAFGFLNRMFRSLL